MSKFLKLIKNNKGATAIEYGLIAALIAVAAIGAMQGIGNKLNTTFNALAHGITLELSGPSIPTCRRSDTSCAVATSTRWSPTTR